eukprot:TRINITY_DN16508_c0_g1_i1.p1 TRINITY_DN16508_c0_g1~~TRINITY_DN16508_c0_g1_i1.p1  ORF type:complete len:247 (+),score=50.16 TRINITY_DN16508_c0_g1_i1:250-990(+)
MKVDEGEFEEDQDEVAERLRSQQKEAKRAARKHAQMIFMVFGVLVKFGAVVFSLVTLILYGGKFDQGGITSKDGHTKLDGPGVDFLVALYILTVFALFALLANAIGPCSFYRRAHFAAHFVFLANDICYAAVAKATIDAWPEDDGGWTPHVSLLIVLVCLLCSGSIMLLNSYKLSGTGCKSRKQKEFKTLRVKAFGELTEVDLEAQEENERMNTTAYARYHEHKQQKLRLIQDLSLIHISEPTRPY